jgi:hypothetical protein
MFLASCMGFRDSGLCREIMNFWAGLGFIRPSDGGKREQKGCANSQNSMAAVEKHSMRAYWSVATTSTRSS